ncbi:MAG TPA: lysophospholipase [Actinomycetota bacterium]|nr:lysophospholipase [Actinomycetota bacterium]
MSQLFERTWPIESPKAAVALVHGLAEHTGRYEHVARALNSAGYHVIARDLRGHGQSPGFPGDVGGELQPVIDDVAQLCLDAASVHPTAFVLAHSMGTLLTIPAIAALPADTLSGAVLSGTAIVPGAAVMESLMTSAGVPPETVSRDPDVVRAYAADDLVFADRIPMDLTMMAAEAIQRVTDAVPLVSIPVLLVHGSQDVIADPSGSAQVHAQLVVTDKTLTIYDGLYHEVLNEPEKDRVISDVIAWLDSHCVV